MHIKIPGQTRPTSIHDVFMQFYQAEDIIETVTDILTSEDLTERYYAALGAREDILSFDVDRSDKRSLIARGCLLFFAIHRLAAMSDMQVLDFINRLAADSDFVTFFILFHRVPKDVGLTALALHATGTTSFIFKAATTKYGPCALKAIQAPYVGLSSIRNATANYAKNFGMHPEYSPKIYQSEETWIIMEFIKGLNLNDYLIKIRAETAFLSDRYLTLVASVFHMIAEALAYYESLHPSLVHGDLTPFNIMIEFDRLDPKAVKLIDFGPNYVLKERAGSRPSFIQAFSRTELFMAPEVVFGRRDASIESDLYSLGVIGLDFLCSEPLRKDMIGLRLQEIWRNPASLGIAQVIEDLIDEDPDNRLLILKGRSEGSIYAALDRVVQEQVKVYKDLVVEDQRGLDLKNQAGRSFKPDVWQSFHNIAKLFSVEGNPYMDVTKGQLLASRLNALCQAVIVSSFVLYTLVDVKAQFFPGLNIPFSDIVADIVGWHPKQFTIGNLWENLPGRVVALTFGLVAARYYANIFSLLRVEGTRSIMQSLAEMSIRMNCLTYFVPIMVAIVFNPKWWPFCTLIGALFPAVNNYLCWFTAREACRHSRAVFSIESFHRVETDRFLRIYREWWMHMGAYSLGIGIIGLLLAFGHAEDEKVYAYFISFINVFKIYRNTCASDALDISGNLSRLFFAHRRWSAKNSP
jgi:serine/threonine protein kinase